jgi:hypothetical protein
VISFFADPPPTPVEQERVVEAVSVLELALREILRPNDILTRDERIDAIAPGIIQDTFRRYLPLDRYTVATLMPAPSN